MPLCRAAVFPLCRLLSAAKAESRGAADRCLALLPPLAAALAGVEPGLPAGAVQSAGCRAARLSGLPARAVAIPARRSSQRLAGGRHDPPLVFACPDHGGDPAGALLPAWQASARSLAGSWPLPAGAAGGLLCQTAAGRRVATAHPQRPLLLPAVCGTGCPATPASVATGCSHRLATAAGRRGALWL